MRSDKVNISIELKDSSITALPLYWRDVYLSVSNYGTLIATHRHPGNGECAFLIRRDQYKHFRVTRVTDAS